MGGSVGLGCQATGPRGERTVLASLCLKVHCCIQTTPCLNQFSAPVHNITWVSAQGRNFCRQRGQGWRDERWAKANQSQFSPPPCCPHPPPMPTAAFRSLCYHLLTVKSIGPLVTVKREWEEDDVAGGELVSQAHKPSELLALQTTGCQLSSSRTAPQSPASFIRLGNDGNTPPLRSASPPLRLLRYLSKAKIFRGSTPYFFQDVGCSVHQGPGGA